MSNTEVDWYARFVHKIYDEMRSIVPTALPIIMSHSPDISRVHEKNDGGGSACDENE